MWRNNGELLNLKGLKWLVVLSLVIIVTACSSNSTNKVNKNSDASSVEVTLREINNFVISDIWNIGIVDVSSYMGRGTSSTGETLDIDFTVQQLEKTMKKKADYDTYMNGLDAKYDSVKQVWSKLSGETDRLYKIIQDTPPKANERNSDFDTGVFNQYMDAFGKEVEALAKQ